jgi:hypothetical protein
MRRLLAVAVLVALVSAGAIGLCLLPVQQSQVQMANGGGPLPPPPPGGGG